jgi:hypothetical protein
MVGMSVRVLTIAPAAPVDACLEPVQAVRGFDRRYNDRILKIQVAEFNTKVSHDFHPSLLI